MALFVLAKHPRVDQRLPDDTFTLCFECLISRPERRDELLRHGLNRHVQLNDAISDWRFVLFHHSPTNVLILCLVFSQEKDRRTG